MDEIERCIDLSAGLNFIYLIGNRYGYMYVPLEIDQDEFEKILEVAREENIENINLIQKWFQLDKNSVPTKYCYVVSLLSNIWITRKEVKIMSFLYSLLQLILNISKINQWKKNKKKDNGN